MAGFEKADGSLPSPWARNYWCPFIRSEDHMRAAIQYVENNPIKAGFKPQHWKMVTPYYGNVNHG